MSVVVVGMHRSGTSVATHAVSTMGLRLGDPADQYTAEDNPDGHFESSRLSGHNEWLLGECGGSWDDPPTPEGAWWESDEYKVPWARKLFVETYGEDAGWIWKDPRVCLLLPFWRTVLGRFTVLFVVRDREAVARSLSKREGWTPDRGRALYDRYVGAALAGMAGHPVVTLAYADLVGDPEAALRRVAEDLRALGEPVDPRRAGEAAAAVGQPRQERIPSKLAGLPPRTRCFLPPTWTPSG